MKYAAPYYSGHHPIARKAKTKKVIPAVERVHSLGTKDKGCSRNKQRQTQACTATDVTHAFLRTTFLPKMQPLKSAPADTEVKKIERDFYCSLCAVGDHYNITEAMDTKQFGYPYNITLAVWNMENHLKQYIKNWDSLQLVQDSRGKTFFISEERYDKGMTLYYIPVIPLYKMLKERETKRAACLLLSVFAYLYHIADIPYYRQEDTYLYWQYEMITDWIEQDDEGETDSRKEELQMAERCGEIMEQKIFNRKNLDVFAQRIKSFEPKNNFEKECLHVSGKIFALLADYPARTVFQHAKCTGDESEDEIITMRKYISFIADTKGWLYETIAECVNNEFNECGTTEEP